MMLIILLVTTLCLGTGAHKYNEMSMEEIKSFLDELYTSQPDEVIYSQYPDVRSSTAKYPGDSSSISSESYPEDGYPMSPSETYPHESSSVESVSDYPESRPDYQDEDGHSEQYPEESREKYPMQVGSIRGVPGINFPDYTDIPLTSFRCSGKTHVPGFYADMETGCQVFHVCWPHRKESFLCPVGTIFNQAILACDYWYSSNCSLASHYYDVNAASAYIDGENKDIHLSSMINTLLEKGHLEPKITSSEEWSKGDLENSQADLSYILKFLPVKAKVVVYPETSQSGSKIIAEASIGKAKTLSPKDQLHVKQKIHEVVEPKYVPVPQKPQPPTHRPQQIHEVVESKYIPLPQKPQSPPHHPQQKITSVPKDFEEIKSKYSHGHIDPSVERIIDQVFDIAKQILKESEGLVGMLGVEDVKVPEKSLHARKPLPLTQIKQRFVVKPAKVHKHEVVKPKPVIMSPPMKKTWKASQAKTVHRHVPKSFRNYRLNVSPSTKKALSANYLKMLKLRSG